MVHFVQRAHLNLDAPFPTGLSEASRILPQGGEARSGHLSGAFTNLIFLRKSSQTWCIILFKTRLIQAMCFAGDPFRLFLIFPLRPGLFLSAWLKFLERCKFSQQFFPEWALKSCQFVFHQIFTPPRAFRKVLQAERQRRDSKGNFWAFIVGFRMAISVQAYFHALGGQAQSAAISRFSCLVAVHKVKVVAIFPK